MPNITVKASVWPNDYPNVPIESWEKRFDSKEDALDYIEKLKGEYDGANIADEGQSISAILFK